MIAAHDPYQKITLEEFKDHDDDERANTGF